MKDYKVGDIIEIAGGHERVAAGNYSILGIGNDVAGNDPAKYKKIFQCKEATTHVTVSIHESDLAD